MVVAYIDEDAREDDEHDDDHEQDQHDTGSSEMNMVGDNFNSEDDRVDDGGNDGDDDDDGGGGDGGDDDDDDIRPDLGEGTEPGRVRSRHLFRAGRAKLAAAAAASRLRPGKAAGSGGKVGAKRKTNDTTTSNQKNSFEGRRKILTTDTDITEGFSSVCSSVGTDGAQGPQRGRRTQSAAAATTANDHRRPPTNERPRVLTRTQSIAEAWVSNE